MVEIEWVWFGLDGVFTDHEGALDRAVAEAWDSFLGGTSRRELQFRRSVATSLLSRIGGLGTLEERRVILAALEPSLTAKCSQKLELDLLSAYLSHLVACDDVPEFLFRLGERSKIGLVTVGDFGFELLKLQRLGIVNTFSATEFEVGRGGCSGDSSPFERAASRYSSAPERCLYVGADYAGAVCAAQRNGMRAVWLNRCSSQKALAVPTIHTLLELSSYLPESQVMR